jgi:hypothetical protein
MPGTVPINTAEFADSWQPASARANITYVSPRSCACPASGATELHRDLAGPLGVAQELGGRPGGRPPSGPISSATLAMPWSHPAPTNVAPIIDVSEMFVKRNIASKLICSRLALRPRCAR